MLRAREREDFETLLVKLKLEQERLLIWSRTLGIGDKGWSEEPISNGDSRQQDLSRLYYTTGRAEVNPWLAVCNAYHKNC